MSHIFGKFLASISVSIYIFYFPFLFNLKYFDVKLFTSCFNYVVHFKTDAFLTRANRAVFSSSMWLRNEPIVYTFKISSPLLTYPAWQSDYCIRHEIQRLAMEPRARPKIYIFFSFLFLFRTSSL